MLVSRQEVETSVGEDKNKEKMPDFEELVVTVQRLVRKDNKGKSGKAKINKKKMQEEASVRKEVEGVTK